MKKITCYGCFDEYDKKLDLCPLCGYAEEESHTDVLHLAPGSELKGTYIIGKVLGYGGFGVTYLAWNPVLEQKVAIKEYLPSEFSTRMPGQTQVTIFSGDKTQQFSDGVDKFVDEANKLAQFRSTDGIVRIFECFKENNTAYIVMEFLDGLTLTKYLEENGKMPASKAIKMLTPIIQSLKAVNEHDIIHRDIAPDNIMITKDDQIKLIDFGAARFATTSHSRSLTVIIKPGYSPEEQYRSRGDHGPWTDVYAIGATLYRMITGVAPPDAMERRAFFEGKKKDILVPLRKYTDDISENQEIAILNAMNVRIEDRTPNAETLEQELNEEGELKRRLSNIRKIDILKWPLWMKIVTPVAASFVITLSVMLITGMIPPDRGIITDENVPDGMSRVPSLIGIEINEATRLSDQRDLLFSIIGKEDSDEIPANMVLTQMIKAGTIVNNNSLLEVIVSGGEAVDLLMKDSEGRYFIADVQFRTREVAIERLELQEMIVKLIEEYNETVAAGVVISQDPIGGTPTFPGTEVTIVVSLGSVEFAMPNVVNITEDEARVILANAGLSVEIEYVNDDSVPVGNVVSQSIQAGEAIRRGTEVTIRVNSNQTLIEVPNLVGQQRNDARSVLTGLGLEVMISEGVSDRPLGEVINQNPRSGINLERNGLVVLTVSMGQCTVRLDARGGTVPVDSVEANIGGTVVLPEATQDNYAFVGWFTSATGGTQIISSTIIDGNMTAFAHWTQDIYTVTFNANGGTLVHTSVQVPGGRVVSLPIPVREHYEFDGWFTSANGGERVTNTTPITSNMTFFAQWTRIVRTVIFDAGVGNVNETTRDINSGDTIGRLPVPTREHYDFIGWHHGNNPVSDRTSVNDDMILTAQWTRTMYTVTFDYNGGNVTESTRSVVFEDTVGDLPRPMREFHTFSHWTSGGSAVNSNTVITNNMTLIAQWTRIPRTVTFDDNGENVINNEKTKTVGSGLAVGTLPKPTRVHYIFNGWFTSATGDDEVTINTQITDNITFFAQWERKGWSDYVSGSPPSDIQTDYYQIEYRQRDRVTVPIVTDTNSRPATPNTISELIGNPTLVEESYSDFYVQGWRFDNPYHMPADKTASTWEARTQWAFRYTVYRYGRFEHPTISNRHFCDFAANHNLGGGQNNWILKWTESLTPYTQISIIRQTCSCGNCNAPVTIAWHIPGGSVGNRWYRHDTYQVHDTQYGFATRSVQTWRHTFTGWGHWSNWQSNQITETGTRQVQVRHRYIER
ncbi:MAG: InlB B-repeat-containing protein [Oscillospiraceae bacterium]|jgi:uncharacterized repeat protein (TIGR02543 family)|nr:InlB B-repeat-containing protein [Oscillospiraceae bacterium]